VAAAEVWLPRAAASLSTEAYRSKWCAAPDAEAAVSYPAPQRFPGGPPGFVHLRSRSFIYDDALLALWRTATNDLDGAARVLATLACEQRPDGAWNFDFEANGASARRIGYVRTGAVAWVLYAFARWQHATGDHRFVGALHRGWEWLAGRRTSGGLYAAGLGRWLLGGRFDARYVAGFCATEHQFDVWFALLALADASPASAAWARTEAASLRDAIVHRLWLPDAGHFLQGVEGSRPDRRSALDAAGTWGALWAEAAGLPDLATAALAHVDHHHALQVGDWLGWRPYAGEAPATWFVEGSVARVVALARMGRSAEARSGLATLTHLACTAGVPLVYATDWAPDFPATPAAAPTLWYLLAGRELAQPTQRWLWRERLQGEPGQTAP
jgi:hypothetical protein